MLEIEIETNFEKLWLKIGSMLAPSIAEIVIAIVGLTISLLRCIGSAAA